MKKFTRKQLALGLLFFVPVAWCGWTFTHPPERSYQTVVQNPRWWYGYSSDYRTGYMIGYAAANVELYNRVACVNRMLEGAQRDCAMQDLAQEEREQEQQQPEFQRRAFRDGWQDYVREDEARQRGNRAPGR